MFTVTYISGAGYANPELYQLDSITTPSLQRACTVADALRLAGYGVRIWRDGKLI